MFIALIGSDGAGKTTVARALERKAGEDGLRFSYVHWIPMRRDGWPRTVDDPATPPPKRARPGRRRRLDSVASGARIGRNLARFWLGYLRVMRAGEPCARGDATLVVADRWIYNYLGQPWSVAYFGSVSVARLAVRLAPRPDLVVYLDAPPQVVVERKGELTIEEATAERKVWRDTIKWLSGMTVNAEVDPEELAAQIVRAAKQVIA